MKYFKENRPEIAWIVDLPLFVLFYDICNERALEKESKYRK
jgi:hypothetical protein